TLRESTMLMLIIGMSLLYSYVMSYLHISQSTAEWIVSLDLSRWVLLTAVLLMVVVLGFFLPPVSIILMTAPIILPPLRAAHFDLIWFGVIMTIVMELGLIHPPVGLNLFVIKSIAPDIPLRDVIWGVMPFVALMVLAVLVLCIFPEIATWLATAVMGGGDDDVVFRRIAADHVGAGAGADRPRAPGQHCRNYREPCRSVRRAVVEPGRGVGRRARARNPRALRRSHDRTPDRVFRGAGDPLRHRSGPDRGGHGGMANKAVRCHRRRAPCRHRAATPGTAAPA